MKKLILAILMFSTLTAIAQENPDSNPKLAGLRKEKNQTVLQQKIKRLENGSAEDLYLLFQYYDKNAAKKNIVMKTLLRKYPNAVITKSVRPSLFLKVPIGEKQEALLQSMIKEYPGVNLDIERCITGLGFVDANNNEKAYAVVNTMKDPTARLFGVLEVTKLIADINYAQALPYATKNLEKFTKIKDQTVKGKSMQVAPKDLYNEFINLYSKLLFKAGDYTEAYKYTKEAYVNSKERDEELTVNYGFLASNLEGKYEEALPILSKAVKEGKNEARYLEEVRKGYSKLNPGKDVDAYIADLQKDFVAKIRGQVEKLEVNETPPDFYLTDVNGKKVTLADFKGKTLVLDFWATWCGPCVASFPAMQMAVNRYKGDPNVKFLFIHTSENVADPLTDAKNFLAKRKHDFDLYMDLRDPQSKRNPALEAFKIDGIPQKYVIDGNGKIRFSLGGFEGKDEAAAEEIIQMVEIAKMKK